ncbi:hypothetical protein CBM2589_B10299 [Cupriavidus taiwanensis]|uniref:Uncharacterized protein n=1 Tax=Cupriavidus taiwanensis TaxID=164546 RepID=A0A375B8M8_9BURK|nr:hypothetical protein CBM2589_B10299 [Cupriavidus taiwanensis]
MRVDAVNPRYVPAARLQSEYAEWLRTDKFFLAFSQRRARLMVWKFPRQSEPGKGDRRGVCFISVR